jgi:hypothetical protein
MASVAEPALFYIRGPYTILKKAFNRDPAQKCTGPIPQIKLASPGQKMAYFCIIDFFVYF